MNKEDNGVLDVKGINDNEVPSVKGLGEKTTPTVEETKVEEAIPQTDVVEPTTVENNVEINKDALDINKMPITSTSNKIDPLAMPTAGTASTPSNSNPKLPLYIGIGVGVVVIIIILIVVLSNGGNKLTCTQDHDDEKTTVTIKFDKDDKVKGINLKMSGDVGEISDSEDDIQKNLDSIKKIYQDQFDNVDATVNGNIVTISMDVKTDNFKVYGETKDKLKTNLEGQGYTCK